jgi:predicted TIM-barrel fold metal-dependent hydrolase
MQDESSMGADQEPFRVDTHHHVFPPRYLVMERDRIKAMTHAFFDRIVEWTPQKTLASMDASRTAVALLSMSTPGIWFGDAKVARDHAAEFNAYCADLKVRHPGRFGFLAALPLPDVETSLRMIDDAFEMGADGIGLMTNAADIWPGDQRLAPVFDDLNRRKAVVFFHPNGTSFSDRVLPGIPAAAIEFPFDTMRAITSLLFTGTFTRCPDIRFVFSHGGGVLPMLAGRLEGMVSQRPDFAQHLPHGVAHELRRQYYDTAGIVNPVAFNAIRQLVGSSQLLFGSDVPFWDGRKLAAGLDDLIGGSEGRAIYRENADNVFSSRVERSLS